MTDTLSVEALKRMEQAAEEPCKMSGSTLFCEVRQSDLKALLSSASVSGVGGDSARAVQGSAEGWKLVPREPTREMIVAGENCDSYSSYSSTPTVCADPEVHWRAMWDAAPSPPAEGRRASTETSPEAKP